MAVDYKQGDILKGQEYVPELDMVVNFTEQRITQGEQVGAAKSEIAPQNTKLSVKKTWEVPTVALAAYSQVVPVMIENLEVPDVLTSLSVVWIKQTGDGEQSSDWNGSASGLSWSLSGQESGSANGSAALIGELPRTRKQFWTRKLPGQGYYLFLPSPVTVVDIRQKIATKLGLALGQVLIWPVFKPEAITFVIKGGKVAVRADVSASAGRSYRDGGEDDPDDQMSDASTGSGTSIDFAPDMNIVEIPPTLHGGFTLSPSTDSVTTNASAAVGWFGSNFPSVSIAADKSGSIDASVTPATIAPTSPTTVPTSGIYITDFKVKAYRWNYLEVFIEVFDASVLA